MSPITAINLLSELPPSYGHIRFVRDWKANPRAESCLRALQIRPCHAGDCAFNQCQVYNDRFPELAGTSVVNTRTSDTRSRCTSVVLESARDAFRVAATCSAEYTNIVETVHRSNMCLNCSMIHAGNNRKCAQWIKSSYSG